ADGGASGDEVRIYEEIPEPVPPHDLFEAGTEPGHRRSDGTRPFVSRAIGTLRQPDAAGTSTEMPAVARDARGYLGVDRFIAAQERQVSVGGGRHDDFDPTSILQPRERREHALTIGVDEVGLRPPVEIGPGRSAATTALVARRLVEPGFAVRPSTVAEDPRQMGVKHEDEVTERSGRHWPLHGRRGKNPSRTLRTDRSDDFSRN